MDKIKEKPKATSSVRGKGKSRAQRTCPSRSGEQCRPARTGLRDTAQRGQRDEYGGDQIEDTAAGGVRRGGASWEKQPTDENRLGALPLTVHLKTIWIPMKPAMGSRQRICTSGNRLRRRLRAWRLNTHRANRRSSGNVGGRSAQKSAQAQVGAQAAGYRQDTEGQYAP